TVEIKYADFRRVASGGTRCVFNLDTLGVKPGGPLLSFIGHYAGECSRNYQYYPIYPKDWKLVPQRAKDVAFEQFFTDKFYCAPEILPGARKFFNKKVGRAWGKSRLDIWKARMKHAEKNNLPEEWILQNPPQGCPPNDWYQYIEYTKTQVFKDAVQRNKANRALQEENHHGGSRPWP
ncbi:hypothetical protein LINPERPRIM_LOCUS6368, partial [Linum perenne]